MKLSQHFTLEEAIISANAIKLGLSNNPDAQTMNVMKDTALEMEDVRSILGNYPISISSWYRSPDVNKAAGSASTSQHIKGEAVDFVCPSYGNCVDVCKQLILHKDLIQFDQLILEHTWVHISFAILSGKPRGQVLSLLQNKKYAPGLTNVNGIPYK